MARAVQYSQVEVYWKIRIKTILVSYVYMDTHRLNKFTVVHQLKNYMACRGVVLYLADYWGTNTGGTGMTTATDMLTEGTRTR